MSSVLVVKINFSSIGTLVQSLKNNFIINQNAVEEAVTNNSMFQALNKETFIKVDFHVGESITGELSRSVLQPLFENTNIPVVSKEDAIASKLLWIKKGSEKSKHDVIGMLLDPTPFNLNNVRNFASSHSCKEILMKLEEEAKRNF